MKKKLLLAAVSVLTLAAPGSAQAAELLYGVTANDRLVSFASDSPGDVRTNVPITGLATGERIVGLDVRPATLGLYALGSSNRLYLIAPVTGQARPVGSAPFDPALNGAAFGFDFNPTVDRIRVVSENDQNLRLNPDTGTVAAADGTLAYAAGDPAAGQNPAVAASAYTNNVPGATTTVLFGIDADRDTLVRQDPPNAGTLNTVGALGRDVAVVNGFDIAASDGNAYAAVNDPTEEGRSELVRIDLTTGAATEVEPSAEIGVGGSAASGALRALATAGQVPDDTTRPRFVVDFPSVLRTSTTTLKVAVGTSEGARVTVRATVAGTNLGRRTTTLRGAARIARFRIGLPRSLRLRVQRSGTDRVVLRITVRDAAGNQRSSRRRAVI